MNKQTIIVLTIVFVFLVIVLIVIAIKNKKSVPIVNEGDKPSTIKNAIYHTESLYKDESFPLKVYMKGPNSLILQRELNRRGASLIEDSYFGLNTEKSALQILGTKEISKELLDKLVKESLQMQPKNATGQIALPSTSTDTGLTAFTDQLYNDLVTKAYPFGRAVNAGSGIYQELIKKSDDEFKKIYKNYKYKFNHDLATDVDNALFKLSTDIDKQIIERSKQLQLVNAN